MSTLSDFLNVDFLRWQLEARSKRSIREYAKYLDVKYTSLVGWMNGTHPPSDENLRKLALKVGKIVYEKAGKPLPPDMEGVSQRSTKRVVILSLNDLQKEAEIFLNPDILMQAIKNLDAQENEQLEEKGFLFISRERFLALEKMISGSE